MIVLGGDEKDPDQNAPPLTDARKVIANTLASGAGLASSAGAARSAVSVSGTAA